jgi:signal transduction histidine kinase
MRSRLAVGVWLLALAALAASFAFHALRGTGFSLAMVSQSVAFFAIGTTGLVLALHRADNPLGWIFLGVWVAVAAIFALAGEYSSWATVNRPGAPLGTFATWLTNWAWVPIFGALLTYPFLLFPDGHLPSPRWRSVPWAILVVTVLWSVAFALQGEDYTDALGRSVANPYTPAGLVPFFDVMRQVLAIAFIALIGICVASLVVRFRRGTLEQRAQLKWLMFAGAVLVAFLAFPVEHGNEGPADVLLGIVLALIPVSIGIAVLKYRLYDIDVIINRALVYGALAAIITAVYVVIVVGIGSLIGSGDRPNVALSVTATAIIAVAFQPVRERIRHLVNRLVYGNRATPYEVLSEFADRASRAYEVDELMPRMARILAEGTGAARATIWVRVGLRLHPGGVWPTDSGQRHQVPISGDRLPDLPDTDRVVPVMHRGELLGALSVSKRRGEAVTPTEERLMADLASQAGFVLRNVRLIEELRASRQRLVAAQDEERRKIERNLHDGAQQQLVALSVQLNLLEGMIERDPAKAKTLAGQLGSGVGAALEDLRDLARGIYPPLLADKGLREALESQIRRAALPVQIDVDGIGRYAPEVEATVYFCALEALQNVAKYAGATEASISLGESEGFLRFAVADDGAGFDAGSTSYGTGLQGMADRLDAIGGTLTVQSAPGRGTTVAGRVPVGSR